MANEPCITSRRRFINLSLIGLAAVPLSKLLLCARALAANLPPVSESDPVAQQLGYVQDATKADVGRFPKRKGPDGAKQFCKTCQFYSGIANAAAGPCTIFAGKSVSASGWCNSWTQKAG